MCLDITIKNFWSFISFEFVLFLQNKNIGIKEIQNLFQNKDFIKELKVF